MFVTYTAEPQSVREYPFYGVGLIVVFSTGALAWIRRA